MQGLEPEAVRLRLLCTLESADAISCATQYQNRLSL